MNNTDTICAIGSAVGPAARMIVRLSGATAHPIAATLCPDLPAALSAGRHRLLYADFEISAWVYLFRSPRSYTGEDLIEFHLPGNPLLVRLLLQHLQTQGARPAEAGEFTARAYFNGRIDLTEAEGVAAVISAHGEREMQAARRLLAGELTRRLHPMMEQLTQALALIEAEIDFAEEPVTFLPRPELRRRLDQILDDLRKLLSNSRRFDRLSHQPQVILVGRPNAGKSTLLNWLAGRPRAIVSPQAGTTRDVLWTEVTLPGGTIHLLDVAGLEFGAPTTGSIDFQMQEHARRAIAQADLAIHVQDSTDPRPPIALDRPFDLHVYTKADLLNENPQLPANAILTSAKTGVGRENLIQALGRLAFTRFAGEARLALNQRHVQAIDQAVDHLQQAATMADSSGIELPALEMRAALDHLGEVLGVVSPDDLLGRIFSHFCIGK